MRKLSWMKTLAMNKGCWASHFSPNYKLSDIFKQEKTNDERNRKIWTAHLKFGYTLKEIADCLGIHYTTVSKVLMDKM